MKSFVLAGLAVPALIGMVNCGMPHACHPDWQAVLARKLELTASQKEAVHAVLMAREPALKAEFATVVRSRMDLAQLVADPQASQDQIRELDAKAHAALLPLELDLNQLVKEIAPILTPAQQAKAHQMVLDARTHVETFLARRK